MATLFVIATPIGNLEDITLRAIRILKEVDLILCEDTRVTKKLLNHYEISTRVLNYDAHATKGKHEHIISLLTEGKDIALVSDAGTPCISDPGVFLIQEIIKALPNTSISPIPGASALISALSASGVGAIPFVFLGFVPQKKGRETFFKNLNNFEMSVAFYESPHRIEKTLASLKSSLDTTRLVVIGRELTKIHEEMVRGSAEEVADYFAIHPDHIRGEFVVMVGERGTRKK